MTGGGGTTSTVSECVVDTDCPVPADPCSVALCEAGLCGATAAKEETVCGSPNGPCFDDPRCLGGSCVAVPLPMGTVLADSTPDCKKPVCDGNGSVTLVAADTDVPPGTECADYSCAGGESVPIPSNEGSACSFGSGACCNTVCCLSAVFKCCGQECCPSNDACCPNGTCKGIGPC